MLEFQFSVICKEVVAHNDDPAMPLHYFLRNDLKLHRPRSAGKSQPRLDISDKITGQFTYICRASRWPACMTEGMWCSR
jgi:hypothetical protein